MKTKREPQVFILYIILVALAETATSLCDPGYGFFFYSVILVSVFALSAFSYRGNPTSNLFRSLSLPPLIRILSLSLPLVYFPRYAWYLVASVPVLAAAVTLMRVQGVHFDDVGITIRKPLTQVGIALTGIPFGIIEYCILWPQPLAPGFPFADLVLLAATLVFSTGLVEEIVFRGVMQRNAIETLGERTGVAGVTALFTALHIGWLSTLDLVFVFCIGFFFGIAVVKTGSIVGVSLSHGITNVFLFLLIPNLLNIS